MPTRQEVEKGRRAERDGTLVVNAPLTAVTDHNGNYALDQMPKGLYWLRATAPGYRTQPSDPRPTWQRGTCPAPKILFVFTKHAIHQHGVRR